MSNLRLLPASVYLCGVACLLLAAFFATLGAGPAAPTDGLYPEVRTYLEQRAKEFDQIAPDRREELDRFAAFIREQRAAKQTPKLIFICTHNSRRSHMGQVWATAAARISGLDVAAYSGGTEVTKFNPRAVAALTRAGLHIEQTTDDEDPIYHVRLGEALKPLTCFSKLYSSAPNPKTNFAAIMTCDQADTACPVVEGSIARFHTGYVDPKEADGRADESKVYDERCAQIARELLYVMQHAAN
jgi:hypothetical protein